ncbi:MAG: SPOR domain-containing protein [Nitrosomonas sp.]|nr:MAG: SPOR domain-containing protein [Nitrosomonas sp.]
MVKIIFLILLAANLVVTATTHYRASRQSHALPMPINAEKIQLVPSLAHCLIWGDFYQEQLQYAEKSLSEQLPNLVFSAETSGNAVMYWLYLPPFPNREAANREINKLRNIGIVSFRIKNDPQWENAISLGIFYQQADALKQIKTIESKGITQVKIEERTAPLRKIVIHQPFASNSAQLQTLAKQFDGTKLIQDKCERL